MLSLCPGQETPQSKYSKTLVQCKCSCGNPDIIHVRWNTFVRSRIPTCGKCHVVKWKAAGIFRYGKLTLDCDLQSVSAVGHLAYWLCDCGKRKKIKVCSVISGNTTTCGCAYSNQNPRLPKTTVKRTLEEWKVEFPDLISSKSGHQSWVRGSCLIYLFRCKCGRIFETKFSSYKPNRKCGICKLTELKPGFRIGLLEYVGDEVLVNMKSLAKVRFKFIECGHSQELVARYVNIGHGMKSLCVECQTVHTKNVLFGRVRIKDQAPIKKYSTQKIECVCSCGSEFFAVASNVINGITKSCGNCRRRIANWYKQNEEQIRGMKCPISQPDIPSGGLKILEVIKSSHRPFKAECVVCGSIYFPRWGGLRNGISLTCGCSTNRVSSGQNEVFKFIKKQNLKPILEHRVGLLSYDISIPSHKLLIEYQGLRWHSSGKSFERDLRKYENALENGWKFISIFEDEWKHERQKIENLLLCNLNIFTSYYKDLNFSEITNQEAGLFYQICESDLNYGAYQGQTKLVACVSFKKNGSEFEFEVVKMSGNSKILIELLQDFIEKYKPTKIVGISDNRYSQEDIYESLDFKLNSCLEPEVYSVLQNRRCPINSHHSTRKISDLGKKTWILTS